MAKAATDEQAAAMVQRWLLDPKHFAITTAGDHAGNSDDNYWGLPSIESQDPAFAQLGYWRGYVCASLAPTHRSGLAITAYASPRRLASRFLSASNAFFLTG